MRWTDLPPDRGADEARPSGLRRSEWEQLRQRLERLPAGHPSSPGGETGEDGAWDQDSRLEHDTRDWERAGGDAAEPPSGAGPEVAARPGSKQRHARRGANDDTPAQRGGHDDHSSRGGSDTAAAGPAPSEPYRPWFASGESAEPWFASGAQAGLIPPIRDRG